MNKYLIMLTFCAATQGIHSKSLFDYNINPNYDLVAQESAGYSNLRPGSEFIGPSQLRYKHQVRGRGYASGHGKIKHQQSTYDYDPSDGYNYHDSSEDYHDEYYHSPHFHKQPAGPARKYDHSHGPAHGPPHGHPHGKTHGHPRGHPHGNPQVIPPRFPPPPVYHKNFMNPWTLSATTPKQFIGQLPPLTTPRPFIVKQPSSITPAVYVSPPVTTAAPTSSTAANDQLMYDIDVRFGRE